MIELELLELTSQLTSQAKKDGLYDATGSKVLEYNHTCETEGVRN